MDADIHDGVTTNDNVRLDSHEYRIKTHVVGGYGGLIDYISDASRSTDITH